MARSTRATRATGSDVQAASSLLSSTRRRRQSTRSETSSTRSTVRSRCRRRRVTRQHIIDSAFKMTEQLVGASNDLAQRVVDVVTLQPPGCRHERLPPRRPPLAGQRHARLPPRRQPPARPRPRRLPHADNGPQVPDKKAAAKRPPPARSRGRWDPARFAGRRIASTTVRLEFVAVVEGSVGGARCRHCRGPGRSQAWNHQPLDQLCVGDQVLVPTKSSSTRCLARAPRSAMVQAARATTPAPDRTHRDRSGPRAGCPCRARSGR